MNSVTKITCVALGMMTTGLLLTTNMSPIGSNFNERFGFMSSVIGMCLMSAVIGYAYNRIDKE